MAESPIEKARQLVAEHASRWENATDSLEFHHVETLPEGGYYRQGDAHRSEEGWYHFYKFDPVNLRLGGTTYLSVHLESGEIRSAVIGE